MQTNPTICGRLTGPVDLFDLRPWARAHRYQVRLEESHTAEQDPEARGDDRAYIEVGCHRGLIYSYDTVELLAWTSTRGVLAELLALDPTVRVHQRGDVEADVRFPARLLDAVAAVLRPKRLPGRSANADDLARLARTGFRAGLQGCQDAPGRDGVAADDPAAVQVQP